jgi:cytochrome c-type biogenesis protein CcmH/NrfG
MTARRRLSLLVLLFAVIGISAYFLWRHNQALPGPGTSLYREYQRAFQVGVAALDAGREELARTNLQRAAALIPGEPAAWADLGLLSLRNNDLDHAAKDLQRAQKLAPGSGEIEALLGIFAEKQGRLAVAVGHYRAAAQKDPGDLASLYALAEAVSREGGPESGAEYQRLMEQILKRQPNNLPVLMQRAGAAFRRQDEAAFRATLDRLARLAPAWSPPSRTVLDKVREDAANAPNEVVQQLQILNNLLKAERGYARDNFAIRPQAGWLGTPVRQFLALQPPRSKPAAPDRNLAFKVEPLSNVDPAQGHVLDALWLMKEKQRAALIAGTAQGGMVTRPSDLFEPAILLADERTVRRVGAKNPIADFPGGPKSIAPTRAGVLALDWDNDFRTDLLLAGAGGLRFWQQRSEGSFADVTDKTGLPADVLGGEYYGAWAADIEMDGDVDIIMARRSGAPLVLRNNGDGTFKALEIFSGLQDVRAFVWADLDSDGAPDAIFLDASGKLHVFANDRSGQFSRWQLPDDLGSFLALTAADVNADGSFDIVALRTDGALLRISDHDNRGSWRVAELVRWGGAAAPALGSVAIHVQDLDNNGALDIIVASARDTNIYLADEHGQFAPLAAALPLQVMAVLDLDGDGRLDFLGLSAEGRPVRALNRGKTSYRWQELWPLANPKAGDNRINSHALGGEIDVRCAQLLQKQRISAPMVHFGLGVHDSIDVARIVWPNGIPQWEFDVPADRLVTAAQRLSGSCPFLFTYDGSGMRFAGDFMWGTPLGMYVNGQNLGDFPQTTEWLKVPGNHLMPRGGYYDVRVHANLWETDYFDQLALMVVDHAPGTEIHVDERFFLAPTPPRLHVTTLATPVARAWDHDGQDVTELVSAIDGRYVDRCGRGRFQGVTRDHWIEVELGDEAPREGVLLLVARGWLHPTNSSINVALAQGKHELPRPLTLEIPDGQGGWRVAGAPLGFPAGKDKTMLIPLDGIDGPQVCRRFRLRTNMEIFWDFLGYATLLEVVGPDSRDGASRLVRLSRPVTAAAELRFRGTLEMSKKNDSSPEIPHYDKVIRGTQAWRDLTGYYTRFGDVRELLARVDDRYVIMNAGDEIALQFPVPAAPPPGWKRDFVWESDGWTRDGDLNTRFGSTVLPLPAHGLKADEHSPGRLEDDPVYRRFPGDWRTYHTRHVTGDVFARGLWAFQP